MHSLRIRTGVQIELDAGGRPTRYRPVVRITGLNRDDTYSGDWMGSEAEALAKARELAADMRKEVTSNHVPK